jgi:hypothetical protein
MTIPANRRIEVRQFDFNGGVIWEPAQTQRWTKFNGPRDTMQGWNVVKFDADGARLLVHDDRIRVVDNRP